MPDMPVIPLMPVIPPMPPIPVMYMLDLLPGEAAMNWAEVMPAVMAAGDIWW